MIVHPTLAAETIRVRFANPYGTAPVTFSNVHAALRTTGPAIDAATDHPVTFNDGGDTLTLAPGEEVFSDPIEMPIAIGDDLAVSFYVADAATLSQHGASRAVSYLATGDHAAEADGTSFTSTGTSWWSLIGVDGLRPDALGTFIGFGDSITDGNDPPDTNNRWPDYFATRLQGLGLPIGVLNAGIGANQVTQDTNFLGTSEAAVKRFARDALARPSVKWMVLFEGTNDLAGGVKAEALFDALASMASRAHAQGIHVIIGTVTPRGKDATWTANGTYEPERVKLNDMLRIAVPGTFDQLADFDAAMAAPGEASVMNPQYDSGDGLHPNPLGLMRLAQVIPVDRLQ
jgi:lysophospholipase L1-like esterase